MATKIDQNGLVTLANVAGFDAAQQNEIKGQAEQSSMSFGAIVGKILAAATAAVQIVIDTLGRKVTVDCGGPTGLLAASAAWSQAETIILTPVAGQTGRSLQFEVTSASTPGSPLALAAGSVVDAVRPSMTVESLVSKITSAAPEGVTPVILVDQDSGVVKVYRSSNGASTTARIDSRSLEGAFTARVSLSEPTVAGEPAPLKFEGGAF